MPGAASNGIHPEKSEDVSFSLGSFAITIPAGRFQPRREDDQRYEFEGWVNGVKLKVVIKPETTGYELRAEGDVLNYDGEIGWMDKSPFGGLMNPIAVAVWIGGDGGTTSVTADLD